DLLVETVDLRPVLCQLRNQLLTLRVGEARVRVGRGNKISGIERDRSVEARDVQFRLREVTRNTVAIGRVGRRIDFDQHIAGGHVIAVGNRDPFHDADFERLDYLDAAGRNDPPISSRDYVYLPNTGPADRHAHKDDDNAHHDAARNRGWGLDDLERGGQKFQLLPSRPALPSDSQAYPPAPPLSPPLARLTPRRPRPPP